LRNKNKKLRQNAWQRLDERCLARSDSRSSQNGVNQPQYFRRLDENKSTLAMSTATRNRFCPAKLLAQEIPAPSLFQIDGIILATWPDHTADPDSA
jgi:6-phosphogluconolactonase/glucosamine-6-phosphate isomerase/deaminase